METWTIHAMAKLREHNLKQKDVAARMGITPEHMSRILNGRKRSKNAEQQIMRIIDQMIGITGAESKREEARG